MVKINVKFDEDTHDLIPTKGSRRATRTDENTDRTTKALLYPVRNLTVLHWDNNEQYEV